MLAFWFGFIPLSNYVISFKLLVGPKIALIPYNSSFRSFISVLLMCSSVQVHLPLIGPKMEISVTG